MISIIRVGSTPGRLSSERMIDALNGEFSESLPLVSNFRKLIVIKKIDPEEYEDRGAKDMYDEDDFDVTSDELEDIDNEVPDEVNSISSEELSSDDDLDDVLNVDDGEDDFDISEEDLADIEAEIPPEVDSLKDSDLEVDPDLEEESDSKINDYL